MNPLNLIPAQFQIAAAGFAVLALLAGGGVAIGLIEKHGEDKAAALYQARLDAANQSIGVLTAANATDEAAIRALHLDQQANDALLAQYQADRASLDQQTADTAAIIGKLQHDDATIAAYLRTPIPAGLLGVLNHGRAGATDAPGAANQGGAAAAAP